MKKKKDMLLIFAFLALISLSDGLFYNFQELWMADNAFSLKTVSIIFSLCSLLTVSIIFLCSNLIRKEKLKRFVLILLFLKIICIFALFILNYSGLRFLIKLFIMIDYVIDIEIYASVYPMMSLIIMDNKAYAKKDLVYNASFYLGVIITIVLLGKSFHGITIKYNSYLFLALIVAILALIILFYLDLNKYIVREEKILNDKLIIENLYDDIKDDIISKKYLVSVFVSQVSYFTTFGLLMILLTKGLDMSPEKASTLTMTLGIIGVFVGYLVLNKLTFKNDYINIGIKFLGRTITYFLAALFKMRFFFFLAIVFTKLSSLCYSHVVDAPYINRIKKDYQLAFCNLKEMVTYLGKSMGVYLCGFLMNIDLRLIFLVSGVFCLIDVFLKFRVLGYRLIEEGKKQ